jgi:transcriptional antiterminator
MLQTTNNRINQILYILLQKNKKMTIKELAAKLDISKRTIRKDLKELQNYLEQENIALIIKPSAGVWLEIEKQDLNSLQNKFLNIFKENKQFGPERRQYHILKKIIEKNNYTVNRLAKNLCVSNATIYKDLKKIESLLNKYNLKLIKSNNNLKIEGKEKDWRKFTAELLVSFKNQNILYDLFNQDNNDSRIDNEIFNSLIQLFDDIEIKNLIKTLENILEEVESETNYLFTDQTFNGLIIHIAIGIERLKDNNSIFMNKEIIDNLKNKKEYQIATFIANKIQEKLNINIPKSEIAYMCLHILGSKSLENIDKNNLDNLLSAVEPQIISIAENIIEMAEDILDVRLKDDKKLLTGLVLHLRPAVNRLKYGLSLRNPILNSIKENYPNVFGAAWAASILFEETIGVPIKEEEVGFIALHLGAALERKNINIKLLLVCGSGIGTAQLLSSKLNENFTNIEIIDSIAMHKLKNYDLKNIDLIISTVPITPLEKPYLQVNPLLLEGDIKAVKKKLNNLVPKNNIVQTETSNNEIFNENLIFLDLDFKSKNNLLEYLCKQLTEQKIVKKGFLKSVQKRENLTSTEIVNGLAIPHGDKKYVLKSKIVLARLKYPIQWSEKKSSSINFVFLLALKNREKAKKFFKIFNQIVREEEFLNNILKAKSIEEILKLLSSK